MSTVHHDLLNSNVLATVCVIGVCVCVLLVCVDVLSLESVQWDRQECECGSDTREQVQELLLKLLPL